MTDRPVYLITGATSGIGRYLACHFASKGGALILHGRDEGKLAEVARSLKRVEVTQVLADLTDASQIERMFEEIRKRHKQINVLVNNAFGKLEDKLAEADLGEVSKHVQTCLAGTANVIKLSIPFLANSKPGFVINIVADWGVPTHNVLTGPSVYVATKYAVYGLGVAIQSELGEFGIRTTNICPGPVAASTPFGESDKAFIKENEDRAIHPETIANAIDFVTSQQFAHIKSILLSPTKPDYTGF